MYSISTIPPGQVWRIYLKRTTQMLVNADVSEAKKKCVGVGRVTSGNRQLKTSKLK